jgi:hypothetical protein
MKHLMFSAILLLALFGAVHQAKATCPPDFTPATVLMRINGCPVEVNICYRCSPLGLTETWIMIQSFNVPVTCNFDPPLTTSELLAAISMEFFASGGVYLYQFCDIPALPPCESILPRITVQQTIPRCMYMENYNDRIWYFTCQDAQPCTSTYELCWSPILGLIKLYLPPSITGQGNTDCLGVQEPPYRPDPGNQTECYKVSTHCDETP